MGGALGRKELQAGSRRDDGVRASKLGRKELQAAQLREAEPQGSYVGHMARARGATPNGEARPGANRSGSVESRSRDGAQCWSCSLPEEDRFRSS